MGYLEKLQDEVVLTDEEKLNDLVVKFFELELKPSVLAKRDPAWAISDMHDFAHMVGQANIHLRDGGYAGDNPDVFY